VAKKELTAAIKLQAPGGQATPAPPVGPALGQHGVNIGQFIQQFNAATTKLNGMPVSVVISVYSDRSFDFQVKSPPAAVLLKDAAKIAKGSGIPNKEKVGTVTSEQLRVIAERKLPDLNAHTIEAAEQIVAGTARSMGIDIVD
jgi:large subunit ribosomal protein L11